MGQTVASLLHSMFQVDPRLLSDCYGGEKFGDGIYYRLIAVSKEKKRWEFFLIFEEKFIAGTIGSVMNIKSDPVKAMLLHAAGYVARQFVERIKRCFPSLQQFELKEEQLLSYGQFELVYEKQSPQFSMLFDTGKGYFAYCMTSSPARKYRRRRDDCRRCNEGGTQKSLNQHGKEQVGQRQERSF